MLRRVECHLVSERWIARPARLAQASRQVALDDASLHEVQHLHLRQASHEHPLHVILALLLRWISLVPTCVEVVVCHAMLLPLEEPEEVHTPAYLHRKQHACPADGRLELHHGLLHEVHELGSEQVHGPLLIFLVRCSLRECRQRLTGARRVQNHLVTLLAKVEVFFIHEAKRRLLANVRLELLRDRAVEAKDGVVRVDKIPSSARFGVAPGAEPANKDEPGPPPPLMEDADRSVSVMASALIANKETRAGRTHEACEDERQ